MERYEYQVVKTPSKSTKYKGMEKGADTFAQTLMDGMNELAREGWQFVRTEVMMEERRSIFGNSRVNHDYMIYRRSLRSNGMRLDEPVSPLRVRKAPAPNIEMLRERINTVMSEPDNIVAMSN